MFISRRCGRWFPERGCILEHQIFSFGKMIMRDRCSTSYDLASLFCGRRNTLDRWSGKTAKCIGTRPSALHSTFLRSHQKNTGSCDLSTFSRPDLLSSLAFSSLTLPASAFPCGHIVGSLTSKICWPFCYSLLRETKNKLGRECKFVARLDLEYLRMCSNEFCKQRK